jgi:hypothetical protein
MEQHGPFGASTLSPEGTNSYKNSIEKTKQNNNSAS